MIDFSGKVKTSSTYRTSPGTASNDSLSDTSDNVLDPYGKWDETDPSSSPSSETDEKEYVIEGSRKKSARIRNLRILLLLLLAAMGVSLTIVTYRLLEEDEQESFDKAVSCSLDFCRLPSLSYLPISSLASYRSSSNSLLHWKTLLFVNR